MRSLVMAVAVLSSIGLMIGMARVSSRAPLPPERPRAPLNGWPVRRHRADTLDSLFIDTPEFQRRIRSGWQSSDQDRVPR